MAQLSITCTAPPNAYPGAVFQMPVPHGIDAERWGYAPGEMVNITVPQGMAPGAAFIATLPPKGAAGSPAGPGGQGLDPGQINVQGLTTGPNLLEDRRMLIQKYQDVEDQRGKSGFQKVLHFLQYDAFDYKLEGMETNQETVFEGLLPGEKVLATLDCFIREKKRSKFYLCCCTVFTLGAYLVWMVCCRCFRSRNYHASKVTLGVLSSGRLVYWHTDVRAEKSQVPYTRVNSDAFTYRRFYKLEDLTMVQLKFLKTMDLFDENDSDEQDYSFRPYAHLRLFFGKFPAVVASAEDWVLTPSTKLSVAELQAKMAPTSNHQPPEDCVTKYGDMILRVYDAVNLLYDIYVMIRGIFEYSIINGIKFLVLVLRNVLNAYRLAVQGAIDPLEDTLVQDRCIDVFIHDDDEYAKESTDGVYKKLRAFMTTLESAKRWKQAMDCDPVQGYHYHTVQGEEDDLLKRVDQQTGADRGAYGMGEMGNSSVGIDGREIVLAEGERIIDAYGEATRWVASDIFKTLITFGLYYVIYLRRTFTKHKAVILTNYRLFQIMKSGKFKNRLPVYGNVTTDLDIKWWTLQGAYAGIIHQRGVVTSAEIATKYGVVKVHLEQIRPYMWTSIKLQPLVQKRMHDFLFACAGAQCEPAVKDPRKFGLGLAADVEAAGGRDRLLKKQLMDKLQGELPPGQPMHPLPPLRDEQVLAQFENENLFDFWVCGDYTKLLCCGFKPVNLEGYIRVSTHRYLAALHPYTEPCCGSEYLITEENYWLWGKWDTPKDFQGWSIQATLKDHQLLCDFFCCDFACPSRRRVAKYSLIDFNLMAFNGRPVQLRSKHIANNEGKMESPNVHMIKQAMEAVMAAPYIQEMAGDGMDHV